MKKLSAFIIAASVAGLFEFTIAKGDQPVANKNKAIIGLDKTVSLRDTIPSKKTKKIKKTIDTVSKPNPSPTPPLPNPNPPVPTPSPAPTPSPNPNPPNPPSPNTPKPPVR